MHTEASKWVEPWQYAVAGIVPPIGVILAIIAWAKNEVGPGLALMATSWLCGYLWLLLLIVVVGTG